MHVAVVTGATGSIGRAIAEGMARAGYEVVLACRDVAKANALKSKIANALVEQVDASSSQSIADFGARFDGPLHVLINNAADTPRRRTVTAEGLETQFATNVLGYCRMTDALLPALLLAKNGAGVPSRVVNVASYWAGDLDLDDLQFERRAYDNDTAYRQSKQANRMLTVAYAERLAADGITVNACHPGDVRSNLSMSLGFGGHETPEQGADTPVWLATSGEVESVTGRWFRGRREQNCSFGREHAAVEALYAACRGLL